MSDDTAAAAADLRDAGATVVVISISGGVFRDTLATLTGGGNVLELDAYSELGMDGFAQDVASAAVCPVTDTCFGVINDNGQRCKCQVGSVHGCLVLRFQASGLPQRISP